VNVAYLSKRDWICVGFEDGHIQFWDFTTGLLVRTLEIPREIDTFSLSPDGAVILIAEHPYWSDYKVSTWDATSGTSIRVCSNVFDFKESFFFTPDSRYFLALSKRGMNLQFTNIHGGPDYSFKVDLPFRFITLSDDGERIASVHAKKGYSDVLRIWNVELPPSIRLWKEDFSLFHGIKRFWDIEDKLAVSPTCGMAIFGQRVWDINNDNFLMSRSQANIPYSLQMVPKWLRLSRTPSESGMFPHLPGVSRDSLN